MATFVYRARRPLHPEKFWDLIQKPFPGVFRAKGFFWLATRMSVVGGLNIAGSECHYSPAGQWWAANPRGDASGHAGIGADATSPRTAILLVALLTAASGLIVTGTSWRPQRTLDPLPIR